MSVAELIGSSASTYTCAIRMLCEEKGVTHRLVETPLRAPEGKAALAGATHCRPIASGMPGGTASGASCLGRVRRAPRSSERAAARRRQQLGARGRGGAVTSSAISSPRRASPRPPTYPSTRIP
jgi:hypothetical protein